jgi:iron complex transport system substrate-binding protein
MIQQLGLEQYLCGVTFECPSEKPSVVRSHIEGNKMSSFEINETVAAYNKENKSLYYIDLDLLEAISPDIIITQGVCEICQISDNYVRQSISQLSKKPKIIPLTPKSLNNVFNDSLAIASSVKKENLATILREKLDARIDTIQNQLKNTPLKKISFIEWIDPIYNCGHWIPDQIKIAGGVDELANPYGYSKPMDWKKITEYNPEIIIFSPCGFDIKRTLSEINILTKQEGWNNLNAVKNHQVYIANADLFTQPSTTLVDGIEVLANIMHPSIFNYQYVKSSYININDIEC